MTLLRELRIDSTARELVSIVGGGGKTTLLFDLADELGGAGRATVVTTTTKMGARQTGGLTVVAPDLELVRTALHRSGRCVVHGAPDRSPGDDGTGTPVGKVTGPSPQWVDELFALGDVDVVVEADGAKHRPVKAPAPHEPVIPSRSSLVVAVVGADALDRVIEDQAHRPMRVAAAAGCSPYDRLTPARCARLLLSEQGGRKSVPPAARFGVVVNKVGPAEQSMAEEVAAIVRAAGHFAVIRPFRPMSASI